VGSFSLPHIPVKLSSDFSIPEPSIKYPNAKIAFSGFLLGNHEKIAFATTSNSSLFSAKMPG
jgi:hypothetical protein